MKKIVVGFMCAIALAGLSGCGNKAESDGDKKEDIALVEDFSGTEIVFWHAMSGSNGEALDKIVKDYNDTVGKEHGVKISTVFQDTEIASKVKLASSTNDDKNAPDIIQTVGMDLPSISTLPQIVPAQTFFDDKKSELKTAAYYDQLLRTFTYEDKIIGVPMNVSTLLLYYNEELLKEAGFDHAPKTIDELAKYIEKLGKIDGINGLNTQITRYQLVNFIVSQFPESFVGDNEGGRKAPMTKLIMDEDGTLDKFLTEWQKVIDSGGYKHIEDNANEEFATGINAMALLSSSRLGAIKTLTADKFTFQTAFLPKVSASDTSGASIGGSSLVLYNRGDNKKLSAAWDFISYATSADVQAEWSQASGYIPVNVATEELPEMQKFYEENPQFKTALEQLKSSDPLSQEPFDLVNWEINDIVADAMQKFAEGKLTKEETAKEIVGKSNTALEEYHKANG
ncbi:extracellular solute-binding protein [Enterococcus sp. BWB1-3]|uniref:extracellular solute-binding protein n=1 Tax=unclassified Enterococcus TaxID=2608891 RepID=UPI00192202E4|nr:MULTISPECIES: extracellular solute-binding protein [unclassified Enterococcus]MBL1227812.1 extracellular solute-binding protein [Enterococcus sp. BWB1-3]MCB5953304.1 extracellular solute-binding protein [Enterococcus sp. BWT-B8]